MKEFLDYDIKYPEIISEGNTQKFKFVDYPD